MFATRIKTVFLSHEFQGNQTSSQYAAVSAAITPGLSTYDGSYDVQRVVVYCHSHWL